MASSSEGSAMCFVTEKIHDLAKAKYRDSSEHFVKLNNYDHVGKDSFQKLKILLNNPDLSRFKKPTPKICLSCCKYLSDLCEDIKDESKNKFMPLKPESSKAGNPSFDKLLDQIETMPLTADQLNRLLNAVGKRLAPLANKYVAELNKKNVGNRMEDMVKISYQSYWKNAFGPLKNILLGMMNGIRYV